jgi:hypothetical protein
LIAEMERLDQEDPQAFNASTVSLQDGERNSVTKEEAQINPKIQDSLDLWQRIRAYDKENAIPVLSKNQKQQVKKQLQIADQNSVHPVTVPTDTVGSTMATSSATVEIDVNLIGSAPHGAIPVQRVPPRLQHDLDLWQHIKEYDKKAAEDPTIMALTKKQQNIMRKELLDGKPPYNTRFRGPSPNRQ